MRIRIGFEHQNSLKWRALPKATMLCRDGTLLLERIISGKDRLHAVTFALNLFWKYFGHAFGQAQTRLTIDDPYGEVRYGMLFKCCARRYCYLDEATIARLLEEARGELALETRLRCLHHPYGSVRRVKRRRKLPFRVAPCLYADANGTFYYRYTTVPQCSRGGRFFRYRKVRLLRLLARDFSAAIWNSRTNLSC